jgi:hypothetical protein
MQHALVAWRRDHAAERRRARNDEAPRPGREEGSRRSGPWGRRSALGGLDLRDQLGDGREEVSDEAVVGDLEDRGLAVLVDRDDVPSSSSCRRGAGSRPRCRSRSTAAGRRPCRSDRPGDRSARTRVARGAARADGRAQRVGEGREDLVELLLERAPARDDDLRLGELGPLALDRLDADELDARRGPAGRDDGDDLDGGAPPVGSAAGNALCRTLTTWMAVSTFARPNALPANIGRRYVIARPRPTARRCRPRSRRRGARRRAAGGPCRRRSRSPTTTA